MKKVFVVLNDKNQLFCVASCEDLARQVSKGKGEWGSDGIIRESYALTSQDDGKTYLIGLHGLYRDTPLPVTIINDLSELEAVLKRQDTIKRLIDSFGDLSGDTIDLIKDII